ncbi:hypothetical protein Cantr_05678 [Candida viswanathii]|uniref:Nuclear pore complex protein NUP96 C-terminal domain-containing protein n=1 Tax=Candida viswanathii TaxID=5486 RepID=A0A367XR35_9ASCO|nr:hypothetical protein Cantr_05678 [Candida viswanathii]
MTISQTIWQYLAANDYWKEAVLVFSSLKDDEDARDAIRDLIISKIQYIKSSSVDKEKYVTTVLKLPREIIYEAVAIQKNKEKDYWGECEAYIEVSLWANAHTVIVDHLGPTTVISNSDGDKSHLEDIIKKFPSSGLIIPDWNKGAGIYEKYLSLLKDEGESLKDLEFLLSYLPFAKAESFEQKVPWIWCLRKWVTRFLKTPSLILPRNRRC